MTVIRRIGALVALLVVIAGLPAGLVAAGAPLVPSGLSWAHVRHLLVTPDMTGSVLVWLVSLIGWVCWIWFTLAVAAEAVTMVSGPTVNLHMPGPQMVRRIAAGLLLAAFAAAPTAGTMAHAAPAPQVAVAGQVAPAQASHAPATPHVDKAAKAAPTIWKTYTVKAGDYLWKIADHYYGDGAKFHEIADASGIDPHSELWVGQKLVLPVPEGTAAVHTVAKGEYLWKIADHYYGDGAKFHEIADASGIAAHSDLAVGQKLIIPGPIHHAQAADTSTPTHKAAQTPSQPTQASKPAQSSQAAAPTPAQAPEPDQTAPASPATTTQATQTPQDEAASPAAGTLSEDQEDMSATQIGITASVGLVLVAGLITVLNRRYRTRFASQPRGHAITLPSEDAQATEIALRRTGATESLTISCLDQALRAIGAWCCRNNYPLPGLLAARVDDDRIDLLLSAPAPDHPEAVDLAADGSVWTLHASSIDNLLTEANPHQAAPWPALVTLGRDDDGAHILLNLEAAGTLHLIADDTDTTMAAIAVELATCAWSDEVNVTLVGDMCPDLEQAIDSPTLTRATNIDALLKTLEARAADQRHILTDTTVAQRRANPDDSDGFDAEVILLDTDLDDTQRDRLARVVDDLPKVSVAAVTTTPTSTDDWTLTLTGDPLVADLAPHGWHIHPQTLDADLYRNVVELLDNSAADDYEPAGWWDHDADDTDTNDTDLDDTTETDTVEPFTTVPRPRLSLTTLTGDIDLSEFNVDDIIDEANRTDDEATPTRITIDTAQPGTDTPFPIDDIEPLSSEGPVLAIIGQPDITGAAGTPGRSPWRCQQLALYIADHPGLSGAAIADNLALSAATVRSIATHLRKWLGTDSEGVAYLPAATGGYRLDERVVTDVDLIDAALDGHGINTASTATLVAVLKLARGRVFAGVPDNEVLVFQPSRHHVEARIVDAALQVTDRALEAGDVELARWALAQGLLVSPDHEDLMAGCVRTEYQAGNMDKVSELVSYLSATARRLGVDLNEDTTRIINTVTHADRRAS